jgi:hypothetical protein
VWGASSQPKHLSFLIPKLAPWRPKPPSPSSIPATKLVSQMSGSMTCTTSPPPAVSPLAYASTRSLAAWVTQTPDDAQREWALP